MNSWQELQDSGTLTQYFEDSKTYTNIQTTVNPSNHWTLSTGTTTSISHNHRGIERRSIIKTSLQTTWGSVNLATNINNTSTYIYIVSRLHAFQPTARRERSRTLHGTTERSAWLGEHTFRKQLLLLTRGDQWSNCLASSDRKDSIRMCSSGSDDRFCNNRIMKMKIFLSVRVGGVNWRELAERLRNC